MKVKEEREKAGLKLNIQKATNNYWFQSVYGNILNFLIFIMGIKPAIIFKFGVSIAYHSAHLISYSFPSSFSSSTHPSTSSTSSFFSSPSSFPLPPPPLPHLLFGDNWSTICHHSHPPPQLALGQLHLSISLSGFCKHLSLRLPA